MRNVIRLGVLVAAIGVAAHAQSTHKPTLAAATDAAAPDPAKTFSENCAACHQQDGKGIEGAFPALAGNKFVLGPAAAPIRTVLQGRGGMPTFKTDLSDAQIAAALTHVRSSWGNNASPVTAADVALLRVGEAPKQDEMQPIAAH